MAPLTRLTGNLTDYKFDEAIAFDILETWPSDWATWPCTCLPGLQWCRVRRDVFDPPIGVPFVLFRLWCCRLNRSTYFCNIPTARRSLVLQANNHRFFNVTNVLHFNINSNSKHHPPQPAVYAEHAAAQRLPSRAVCSHHRRWYFAGGLFLFYRWCDQLFRVCCFTVQLLFIACTLITFGVNYTCKILRIWFQAASYSMNHMDGFVEIKHYWAERFANPKHYRVERFAYIEVL